jgi:fructokinase
MTGEPLVTVIGEALLDLVPSEAAAFTALPAGSPFNVAVGLRRLGVPVALMARLADQGLGGQLRAAAEREGIDLSAAPTARQNPTLAIVSFTALRDAEYSFYVEGTADWQWTGDEIERCPDPTQVLHFGSLASWTPPGAEVIRRLAGRLRGADRLVTYDPNVRPALISDLRAGRSAVEACVALAHLVKASSDDLELLYPSVPIDEVAGRWLALGASLVVVTGGRDGARAYGSSGLLAHQPGLPVSVVDTVGAGDAFTAGLLAGLVAAGSATPSAVARLDAGALQPILADANAAAALTCQRAGADPPTAAELHRAGIHRALSRPLGRRRFLGAVGVVVAAAALLDRPARAAAAPPTHPDYAGIVGLL